MTVKYTYIGKLRNSFICDKRLSAYDVRVYLALKKWQNWDKEVKIETMAKEIGVNRKTFSKSLKTLEELKYIAVTKNSNWDCYKYEVLNKAHVTETDTDGNESHTDGNETDINDGYEIPLQSITKKDNYIKKKNNKKEKDTALAVRCISLFNEIANKKKDVNNPSHISKCLKIIAGLRAAGVQEEAAILEKFRYVFTNKKKMNDDPAHYWNHFKIGTLLAKENFFNYLDEDEYIPAAEKENEAARRGSELIDKYREEYARTNKGNPRATNRR